MSQSSSVREQYLQADVFSATPQKLQLLLVEATMKNILRTKKHWEEGNIGEAFETLTKAQDIVAEILCSLDVEGSPEIAKKLASIYVFIFRRLAEAGMSQDTGKLDDAYRVLCSERETWKLVCEKFGSTQTESTVPNAGDIAATSSLNHSASFSLNNTPSSSTATSDSGTYTPGTGSDNPKTGSGTYVPKSGTGTYSLPTGTWTGMGSRTEPGTGTHSLQSGTLQSGTIPLVPTEKPIELNQPVLKPTEQVTEKGNAGEEKPTIKPIQPFPPYKPSGSTGLSWTG